MPLAQAARYAGVTAEHLNLLARRGKLLARKIGRNWFTTRQWLDAYFRNETTGTAEQNPDIQLELRRIEKEEKLELAKIQAQLEFRRIEVQEKLERMRAPAAPSAPLPINIEIRSREREADPVMTRAAGFAAELFKEELDKIARQAEAQIAELQNEKQLMAEFFTRELDEIRTHLVAEQEQKQMLISELQAAAQSAQRNRVVTELETLKESFAKNLTLLAANFEEAPVAVLPELVSIEPDQSEWQHEPLHREGVYYLAKNMPLARRRMAKKIGASAFAAGILGFMGMWAAPHLSSLGTEQLFAAEVGERMGAAMIISTRDLYEKFAPSFAYHFTDFSFAAEPFREFYEPAVERGLALYEKTVSTPVDLSPFTDEFREVLASFTQTTDRLGEVAGATTFRPIPWQGGASTAAPPE